MPEFEADASAALRSRPFAKVRLSRELLAGLVLVLVAGFALWASADLEVGTLRSVGPGAVPRGVALLVLCFGIALSAAALVRGGTGLGRWPLRGPVFVCLAIAAFALTIRTLGLAVAGPALIVLSGLASDETRYRELVVFALVITAACVGLFRFALGLPIPVLVIPGLLHV